MSAPEVKKLNKQVRDLIEENERLRSGCVILLGVREIVAENVALRKREASLAAGYRDAIDTMQDACDATGPGQDYELQIEVDAHRAVAVNPIPVYKMSELIHWANVLRIAAPERYDEAHAKTADLARELFPPMAKPLVWVENAGSFIAYCGGRSYFVQYSEADFNGARLSKHLNHLNNDEAKAACEAHNQARFLEQLA